MITAGTIYPSCAAKGSVSQAPTRIRRCTTLACAVALALSLTGCAKTGVATPAAPQVGCVAGFDCTTGNFMITAQAAIEKAKVGVPAAQKALLNQIIAGYNALEGAYTAYHALVCGTGSVCTVNVTPAISQQAATQQAALQSQVSGLQTQIAKLGVSQ